MMMAQIQILFGKSPVTDVTGQMSKCLRIMTCKRIETPQGSCGYVTNPRQGKLVRCSAVNQSASS